MAALEVNGDLGGLSAEQKIVAPGVRVEEGQRYYRGEHSRIESLNSKGSRGFEKSQGLKTVEIERTKNTWGRIVKASR